MPLCVFDIPELIFGGEAQKVIYCDIGGPLDGHGMLIIQPCWWGHRNELRLITRMRSLIPKITLRTSPASSSGLNYMRKIFIGFLFCSIFGIPIIMDLFIPAILWFWVFVWMNMHVVPEISTFWISHGIQFFDCLFRRFDCFTPPSVSKWALRDFFSLIISLWRTTCDQAGILGLELSYTLLIILRPAIVSTIEQILQSNESNIIGLRYKALFFFWQKKRLFQGFKGGNNFILSKQQISITIIDQLRSY